MNWKQVKERIKNLGVKDEDEIKYIDAHPGAYDMYARKTESGWEIEE